MKRADKLKAIQDALRGQPGQLQQLHREKRKKSMPYLEVHGIIDASRYPPQLLDLIVWYGEVDEKPMQKPLSEWVNLLNKVGKIKQYGHDTAIGFIDANDNQYDTVSLSFAKVRSRNFSYWYLPDCTIGDLRRYYNQSEASFSSSILPVWFDADMSQYERYSKPAKPI